MLRPSSVLTAAFRIAFVAALLLLPASSADALMFTSMKLDDGRTILWVRDCGPRFKDTNCTESSKHFSSGDSARLRQVINRKYDEIWLASNGGSLDEGIKVGEVFREMQATVRVPAGLSCVSACTVAFMGGFFRIVDDGATYEVHAASAFLGGFDGEYQGGILKELNWNPQDGYARFAKNERESARDWASRLLPFFQQGLLPLGRQVSNGGRLQRWLQSDAPTPYLTSASLMEDAERFRREGTPSAQETLMRIERESMDLAIEELRAMLPDLGPRAEPALGMLEAMYSSRITLTASLSHETLLKMGYITSFVGVPKP